MSEQSMRALEHANTSRLNLSEIRRELTAGTTNVADALHDRRAQPMQISRLLCAQPHWGPVKASQILNPLYIWPTRRVRDLTPRQRAAIVDAIAKTREYRRAA